MKRQRWALACAAVATALSLSALLTLPAKADGFVNAWFSAGSGKCLGVLGGNMTNGTPVVQWTCNGQPDQQWLIDTSNSFGVPDGHVTAIRNSRNPNKCLSVLGGATNNGANLVIWDCNFTPDQSWIFQNIFPRSFGMPNGCWKIENQSANRVVGILGGSHSDGAQAVLWDDLHNLVTHPDQEFC